ncbi:MAG: 4-hydroxyphenylpyruvate dioxygenase [Bdellovibrionaceae bacterium]|nr:4-hydroxyphenylpyruvate dioxygenase [Pseudobdellovibrionaceae bacterium]|tara:strand:+ start:5574 stop:6608 length:1035 start_codon:yes stop_codon:yes gene_type:complete
MSQNPLGLNGIEFVEFSTNEPEKLHQLFLDFGFSKVAKHKEKNIDLYGQNNIHFLLNYEKDSFADQFQESHGPSISSMGWRFKNPEQAYKLALQRGAQACEEGDYQIGNHKVPAIYGIGDSLIYFVTKDRFSYEDLGFEKLQDPIVVPEKGFLMIDHLTNNVYKGTMERWAAFYKDVFGFEEVRYFDIKGQKTGLTSYALKSPCGLFSIPINEADEAKSQINEYLDEYKGPGVQHLAFLTRDLLKSLHALENTGIQTLDIAPDYYASVFQRVPEVKEDKSEIERLNVLVDGDEKGYLLQIFTKNVVGPIFIEMIQRENHLSFGEGNFQALFDSIERDQIRRGVL